MSNQASSYKTGTVNTVEESSLFFVEEDPFDSYTFRLSKVLFHGNTKYQNVLIGDTYSCGRTLVLGGDVQSAESDEDLYHEVLVQPAMLRHENPQDVLIIGGGEGATLREVLAHKSVKSATMVDLDSELVELCRIHLEKWHQGAFDDPRTNLIFGDGRKFVEQSKKQYDVVIIDVVDMLDNGPAQTLYTRQFYQYLQKILKPKGIVAVQALEFSYQDSQPHAALARTLKQIFPEVHSYNVCIPSFLSSWGFLVASDWFNPSNWTADEIDKTIEAKLGKDWMQHLTGGYLKSLFELNKLEQKTLAATGPILEDGVEFVLDASTTGNKMLAKGKLPALS